MSIGLQNASSSEPEPWLCEFNSHFPKRVSDLETRRAVGPNERGEICVKGPALWSGYVGMSNADNIIDDEGFLKTGDLGYYDGEELFIDGRLKEVIKCGGGSVPPADLEAILQLHPGVKDAGVVGQPDPVLHDIPLAFVVRQPGHNVTEEEIIQFVNQEVLPKWQLKGGVKFIEEVPRNDAGKILRQQLKDLLK